MGREIEETTVHNWEGKLRKLTEHNGEVKLRKPLYTMGKES
jgi:hypothetical protein